MAAAGAAGTVQATQSTNSRSSIPASSISFLDSPPGADGQTTFIYTFDLVLEPDAVVGDPAFNGSSYFTYVQLMAEEVGTVTVP